MDLLFNERQELINQMERIFYHLGYKYSEDALNKILTEWFNNKKDLIELMSKHPNYVPGKFYIQFDCDFSRDINTENLGILYNSWYIDPSADIREEFLHKGNEVYQKRLDIEKNVFMPSTFVEFLNFLQTYSMPAVDENFISEIEPLIERYGLDIKIAEGMKTSRAINKFCVALGLDKMSNYNKIFAVYADALSPLKVKRHTVISCNPIDYLLMSNGNSWTSCHTINKFSKSENNYGGCCASGTISYMLDGTSMVYYEVSADYEGNEIEMEPKIMRQMFHFGQHALVQGRLYPQSNDNGKDFLYAEMFLIVGLFQRELVRARKLLNMKALIIMIQLILVIVTYHI